jgi:predicted HicB family RNase H-like nuclease
MSTIAQTSGTMMASDLLATQAKKFTMEMPSHMHQKLKMIAAANQTTLKDLIMEAVENYIIPNYQKGTK